MKAIITAFATLAALTFAAQTASGQVREPMPPTITVSANGSVDYVPDIARVQLGIRAQAASASAAAATVNQTAAQVVAAIQRQGISERSIQTSGYNLEYREPQPPAQQQGAMVSTMASTTAGSYVASEMLQVTTPVRSAGAVLDAAITAGANTSYGLTYQSSNADALYRTALAKAVQSARSTAEAIASAAHLTIVRVASISNTQEQMGPQPMMRVMASAAAPILAGTDTVTATVFVVYLVK